MYQEFHVFLSITKWLFLTPTPNRLLFTIRYESMEVPSVERSKKLPIVIHVMGAVQFRVSWQLHGWLSSAPHVVLCTFKSRRRKVFPIIMYLWEPSISTSKTKRIYTHNSAHAKLQSANNFQNMISSVSHVWHCLKGSLRTKTHSRSPWERDQICIEIFSF